MGNIDDKKNVDIAIIGAGISGVYSAWKLQQQYPDKRIVVYEADDHVGGRLLSVVPPGIPDMVAELGGMRILENGQPLIVGLIKELNETLPGEEQITLYDFPVDQPQNIAYLRGEYLRLSDFTQNPDKVPYKLSFIEQGNTPGSLIINAIKQIVPGVTDSGLTEEDRRQLCRAAHFDGRPLYEQGFWNVLSRVISGEAYLFGRDAGGYSSTLMNWNACDAIPWYLSDFGIDPKYKGFTKGYQQVPEVVAAFFEKAGGHIQLNARLQCFTREGENFRLVVNDETVIAGSLILAMPRRALDLLAPSSPLLQTIQPLISSVTPRPLFKLFTTYSNPWWLAAGYTGKDGKPVQVKAGRSVTDLPVRQTYYWPKKDGSPALEGKAMLLASYDDGTNIGYWDGLRPQRSRAWKEGLMRAPISKPFHGEVAAEEETEWSNYEAPAGMVNEIARQLQQMHGLSYTPDVRSACFRDWGEDPFGGGWNSWNIGVKSWEVKERITQPIDGVSLFICGEAYSDAQGWVEGALQTADIMLPKVKKAII